MAQITGKLQTRPLLPQPIPRVLTSPLTLEHQGSVIGAVIEWSHRFSEAVATTLWDTLAKNLVFIVSNTGSAVFGAAETSVVVTFLGRELDAGYQVFFTPSWDTRFWVTDKTMTGFTLHVSTAPGGGGGTVDWGVVR